MTMHSVPQPLVIESAGRRCGALGRDEEDPTTPRTFICRLLRGHDKTERPTPHRAIDRHGADAAWTDEAPVRAPGGRWVPAGPIVDQPAPQPADGPSMHDLVIADMYERKQVGKDHYGTILQAHNGRDALIDAYQEALDLVVYLRQAIEERGRPTT
jgi:hypothetical protein